MIYLDKQTGTKIIQAVDIEGYDIVLSNDFLYIYNPYISFLIRKIQLTNYKGEYEVQAIDSRVLDREERGMLNLLSKKDVYQALKDKNTEYIVFYTVESKGLDHPTNNLYLAKLLKKYTDIFVDNLPKRLPLKYSFVYYIDIGTANLINVNIYPLSYKKLEELRK